jgi:4-hydroxythreonine-4-phosphate dehydrogenase
VTTELPVIVVSSGEPAGIGPDICHALAKQHIGARVAVLGDHGLFAERARKLRLFRFELELDSASLRDVCGYGKNALNVASVVETRSVGKPKIA